MTGVCVFFLLGFGQRTNFRQKVSKVFHCRTNMEPKSRYFKIMLCVCVCVRLGDPVCQLAVPGGPPRPPAQPGAPVCGLGDVAVGPGRGAGGQPLPHVAGQEEIRHR